MCMAGCWLAGWLAGWLDWLRCVRVGTWRAERRGRCSGVATSIGGRCIETHPAGMPFAPRISGTAGNRIRFCCAGVTAGAVMTSSNTIVMQARADGSPFNPASAALTATGAVAGGLIGYSIGRSQNHVVRSSHTVVGGLATSGKAASVAQGSGVFRAVLTGGPCGGKSSSQEHIRRTLTQAGYDVYFAPEVPTIMINGGCAYPGEPQPLGDLSTARLMSLCCAQG